LLVAEFSTAVDPNEDGAKLALQGDGVAAALLSGSHDAAIDDPADGVSCIDCLVGMIQRLGQTLDPAPVGFRDARMPTMPAS